MNFKKLFLVLHFFLIAGTFSIASVLAQEGQFCEFNSDCPDEVTKWCTITGFACEHFRHFRCENNICTLLIVEHRVCFGPCEFGCVAGECLPNPDPAICEDKDGDGYGNNCDAGLDCDDTNSLINPIAKELCTDEADNNCDRIINEFCENADKFRCSNDNLCSPIRENFCNANDQACTSILSSLCVNPGKENSGCVTTAGGGGCRDCEFGCELGMCLEKKFIRGDSDGNGRLQLTDVIFILNYLFRGDIAPQCEDAADADDDGRINLTDAIYILLHLFQGGQAPPAPYPEAGVDTTEDSLECKA